MIKKVESLADVTLPETGTVDIPRGKDSLRVPIKAISLEDQQRMSDAYEAPSPPRKMGKDAHGKATGVWYHDADDPVYKATLREARDNLMKDMTISGLAFEVDGEDISEKWSNIAKKLTPGDLSMILDAVNKLSNISDEMVDSVKNF